MIFRVGEWLEGLGFAQLKSIFEAQAITADVLPDLTDTHLREMGIPIGHRVRLLAAIAQLDLEGVPDPAVERRRLTVMFADLVGSTQLSTQLDPEDLREVLRAFHRTINEEVEPYDAFVAQYQGDGALVYFGYPRAHEDDAERAVRAALVIVRSVAALHAPSRIPLAAHIGIATGLTVVGDRLGRHSARERTAIGETPNLAARLVNLARSGEVIVGQQTHHLTRHQFEFEALGFHRFKGLDDPVMTYRVLAEKPTETSFDARQTGVAREMVGRADELTHLKDCWSRAVAGHGSVVLIAGEAGIGKSRLVRALDESIAASVHARVSHQCSPHHVGSTLYPIAHQLKRTAKLAVDEEPEGQLNKLREALNGATNEELALIAAVLDIDAKRFESSLEMTPAEQRQRTFRALAGYLERMARAKPTLWLVEDTHWIDPTSLELIELFFERVASLRLLVIVTFRPEFEHAFPVGDHVSSIQLSRLTASEVSVMVRGLGKGKRIPLDITSQIAIRTDGVPLFVEELTKSLLESGELVESADAYVMQGSLNQLTVPASLHDSLMARLDRHRLQREVAQIASCIGREFGHGLLEGVADMRADVLHSAIKQLEEAELIFRQGVDGDRRYVFKHALVRDAAYESLLKRRREELHARILSALETLPESPAEVLALHAVGAGLASRAVGLWMQAGKVALSRAAFAETVSHLTQALQLNAALADDRARKEQRVDLLLALGQATIPLRGYSHSTAVEIFSRAQELAHSLADGQRTFWVSYARWVVHYVRGEHSVAYRIASEMLDQAGAEGNDGRLLTALRARGISEMIAGTPLAADATFARAEKLADRVRQQPRDRRMAIAQRYAADPDIATQFHVALTHWALGRTELARTLSAEAVSAARLMGHVHTLGHALTHAAIIAVVDHDPALAVACCIEVAELAERHDMELWRGYGGILHGFALAHTNDIEGAAWRLQSGLALLARAETGAMVPVHHAVCAWAFAKLGRPADARVHERVVRHELSFGSERYFRIETLVWLARYTLLQVDANEGHPTAEQLAEQALLEARSQGAVGWEMRAATALGHLRLDRGAHAGIRELIVPVMARLPTTSPSILRQEAEALLGSVVN